MRIKHLLLVLLTLILPVSPCLAQADFDDPAEIPVEAVMDYLPSGTMGVFVVHNIDGFIDKLDAFIGEMMGPMGQGMSVRMYMSYFLPTNGLNMNGDFAAIMLDPSEFGVDVMSELRMYMGMNDDMPMDADAEPAVWPFVLFVPGDDFFSIFPVPQDEAIVTIEGDVTCIESPYGDKIYTAQLGSYLLIGMRADAVQAVINADETIEADMSEVDMSLVSESDISAYVNMRIAGPLFMDLLQMLAEEDPANLPYPFNDMPPGTFEMYADVYGDLLDQMDAVNLMFTFTETGLKLQEALAFAEDSVYGEYIASLPVKPGNLLGSLPNNDYIFAIGSRGDVTSEMKELSLVKLDDVLEWEAMDIFSDEVHAQIRATLERFYDQVDGMQLVIGGAPEGYGTIGAALVLDCEDSAVLMSSLEEDMTLMSDMLNTWAVEAEKDVRFSVALAENFDTIAGAEVTRVTFDITGDEMDDEELEAFQAVLNMNTPTIFVAAPDANTVVYTFGGDMAMVESVLGVQTGMGAVANDEGIISAMDEVTGEPFMLMSISLGNLGKVGAATMLAVDPETPLYHWPLADMTNTKPILVAGSAEGSTIYMTAFVETDVLVDMKDSIVAAEQAHMIEMRQQMQERQNGQNGGDTAPAAEPAPADEGF
jgi:hypothetical protein